MATIYAATIGEFERIGIGNRLRVVVGLGIGLWLGIGLKPTVRYNDL